MTFFLVTDWNLLPGNGRVEDHVFAMTDIHGRADLLAPMLDHLAGLRVPDHPKRTIVFCGDIIDRGAFQLETIRLVLGTRDRFDRSVILPGNHEQMMLEALRDPEWCGNLQYWYKVGGHALVEEINPPGNASVKEVARLVREALPEGFENLLLRAPSHHVEGPLLFVHAGLDPIGDRRAFLNQGIFDHHPQNLHWAWISKEFLEWRGGWDGDQSPESPTIVVHGHSIEIRKKIEDLPDLVQASDRVKDLRRINLDLGGYHFGQLAALEVFGRNYRLHAIVED